MIYEGDVVATWEVGGLNYCEMTDEAISDAQLLMEGINPNSYSVFVYQVQPQKDKDGNPLIKDGTVEKWKGTAVVVWSLSSRQSLNADAVEADSQLSQASSQLEQS